MADTVEVLGMELIQFLVNKELGYQNANMALDYAKMHLYEYAVLKNTAPIEYKSSKNN